MYKSHSTGGHTLTMVARVEQRRAPPPSNKSRRLHVQPRHHVQARGRRVVDRRGTAHVIRQVALAVLLRVAARLRAALLPVPVVGLHVLRQMVRSHKSLVAYWTGETFLTSVRPEMPLEFVRPGEALPAEQPIADERPLSRVPAQMRLQVRRLTVNLPATGNVATVDVLLPQVHPGGT